MKFHDMLMTGTALADGNFAFFGFVVVAALTLLALIKFGIRRRQTPRGKLIAIMASLMLFILVAAAGATLFIAGCARHGSPM